MIKRMSRIISAMLLIAIVSSIPVLAVEPRASEYISWYFMDVIPTGSGVLAIDFSIAGIGKMNAIGVESIEIDQKNERTWVYAGSFDRNDENMIDKNTAYHGSTIYFNGTVGVQYKVTVTLFSENSNGYDSRTETFILTAT